MPYMVCFVCLCGWADIFALQTASAEDLNPAAQAYELDTIVVTATKTEEPIPEIPKHVTVITRSDIEQSAGKNIMDILAKEAGVTVRSQSGNDKQAVIDIRGMGDTAASNVIVMVDGLPLNAADQSAPAISTVPVEQIERIEIVRGAGSVVYGSGAVGGVINIITRKKVKHASATLYSDYGTDNTLTSRAGLESNVKDVDLSLNAGYHNSDGYRDNGFLRKKDMNAATRYPVNDHLSLMLSGTYYEDKYGLPGPVPFENINSRSRRVWTHYPDDAGESTEMRGKAGIDMNLGKWGQLTLNRGYVSRDNRYIMGFSPQIPRNDQKDRISDDTRQLGLNYVKYYTAFGLSHMFQMGVDHAATDYVRTDNPAGPRKNSKTQNAGIFINNQWSLTDKLMLNAGTRYNTYDGRFRTDDKKLFGDARMWVNGDAQKRTFDNSAYSLGATYAVNENASVFADYATSFRIPNVDEFAECEEGLKPQKGVDFEIGGRRNFDKWMAVTVSAFDMRIDDEIYYSDINRNYKDKTIRQGFEADVKVNPLESVGLWGHYTFTDAQFAGKNSKIPLVPAHVVSAGVNWKFTERFELALSSIYSGARYDGNDLMNTHYRKLGDYMVFDSKLTWRHENWTVFAGINNIFNKLYSTSAYSEQYYPMPDRNIFGGVRWTWL